MWPWLGPPATSNLKLKFISVDSNPRRGIRPGPTNLCVLMSQLAAAAAPQGPTFSTLATHGYLWAN